MCLKAKGILNERKGWFPWDYVETVLPTPPVDAKPKPEPVEAPAAATQPALSPRKRTIVLKPVQTTAPEKTAAVEKTAVVEKTAAVAASTVATTLVKSVATPISSPAKDEQRRPVPAFAAKAVQLPSNGRREEWVEVVLVLLTN
jgi:hypothetical protein